MNRTESPPPFYSRGGLSIYHADCRFVLTTFAGESFDFVLTDPPYLVNYRGRWDGDREPIAGDDRDWLHPAYAELWRLLKPDTFCVSFYGWPQCDRFVGVWKQLGFRLVSHLAFVKNVWGLGRFTRGKHETAFLLAKNPSMIYSVKSTFLSKLLGTPRKGWDHDRGIVGSRVWLCGLSDG